MHQKVWGAGRDATYNNIEVYLTLVRRKLRAVGSKAELISSEASAIICRKQNKGKDVLSWYVLLFFLH
ncbi:hypothetical protein [Agathobaculum butyriciproducens]|uniref:hypothetical protein n=1 Tax=Agathobaculum butyriciproducens TaxID=1628085 RepID=UPI0036D246D3